MPKEDENALFGYDEDMFAGYFSDSEITDIPELYIGQVIDYDALSKVSRQLIISMGGLMKVVVVFSAVVFLILIYVLTKLVIEKNAQPISMTKIVGYYNREISRLYIASTSVAVVVSLVAALPLVKVVLQWLYELICASKLRGWIPLYISPWIYFVVIIMGLVAYLVVSLFEMKQIRMIPMGEALKNVD